MPTYPTILFVLRHQKLIPVVAAGLILSLGLWGGYRLAPELSLLGLVLAGVMYAVTRCFLELVQVVADTLMPR
jgi:hypothetical protein